MATVYLAIQESFQREVALKVMSAALSEDENFSERFLTEARIVSRLMHPNIVTVHDVGIHEGYHYLSMEYIPGKDLKQSLASLTGRDILRIGRELAAALDYAGQKGYIHRDVKPENVMLHADGGRAVLMDFGIAKATDVVSSMTQTGMALGTPHYMSPEQARGKTVDARSDLYSLGVLAYLMLVGRVPYDGESAVEIGIKHISDAVPTLPVALAEYQPLLDKLLAKKPGERYQTGAEVVAALKGMNAAAIDAWRANRDFSDTRAVTNTPLRNTALNVEAIGGEQLPSKKSAPARAAAAKTRVLNDARETKEKREKLVATSRNPSLTVPSEVVQIPREDLAERRVGSGREGRSSLPVALLFLLLLVVGAAAGYYQQFGLSYPPPQAKLDTLLARLDSVLGLKSVVHDTDEKALQPAVSPVEKPLSEFARLQQQVAAVELAAESDPAKIPELVALYQQVLALQADHPQSIYKLKKLKTTELQAIETALAEDQLAEAEQKILAAASLFPELSTEDRYRSLQERLALQQKLAVRLTRAEQLLAEDKLLRPADDNALKAFQDVLALKSDNERALAGVQRIVARYLVLAKAAQGRKQDQQAMALVNSGLSVNPDNQDLRNLKLGLSNSIQRDNAVKSLLEQAAIYEAQQEYFDPQGSAASSYKMVLDYLPGDKRAGENIQRLIANLSRRVNTKIEQHQLAGAEAQLKPALMLFPDNSELLALQKKVADNMPKVSGLVVDGKALVNNDAASLKVVRADRALYIGFHYEDFYRPTTVLQASLYSGNRRLKIASVPVVVKGATGEARVRMDRAVDGFSEGSYHIDIMLAGERVATRAFDILN